MKTRSLLALAACCSTLPAAALLIRPDRDDAEYLELASRYTSCVRLDAPGGDGVLIAPRWVLTSEKAARTLREMKPRPKIAIGRRQVEIQQVYIHDGVGLVSLKSDVTDPPFTPPYRGADESGKTVVIAGHGETGRIGEGTTVKDGKKRASINTIDRISAQAFGMQLKPATEASDLQGAITAGDIGAPAYLETPEGLQVAGIARSSDGTWETYARVSAYAAWIDSTMLEQARQEADALLGEK